MSQPIRLLFGDDHPILLRGIAQLFEKFRHIQVVGTIQDENMFVSKVAELKPDVAVLDMFFGKMLASQILSEMRRLKLPTKVIVYTVLPETSYIYDLLRLGAAGFLNKNCSFEEMVKAVETVHSGKTYLSEQFRITSEVQPEAGKSVFDALSKREFDVMLLLIRGWRQKDIMEELDIGHGTLSSYISRIYRKMGVENVPDLVRLATVHGIQ